MSWNVLRYVSTNHRLDISNNQPGTEPLHILNVVCCSIIFFLARSFMAFLFMSGVSSAPSVRSTYQYIIPQISCLDCFIVCGVNVWFALSRILKSGYRSQYRRFRTSNVSKNQQQHSTSVNVTESNMFDKNGIPARKNVVPRYEWIDWVTVYRSMHKNIVYWVLVLQCSISIVRMRIGRAEVLRWRFLCWHLSWETRV